MAVTLVLPPLTQLNTPYPGTAFLARHLREAGEPVHLVDLGIELALRVFSREGLAAIFDAAEARAEAGQPLPEPAWRALALRERHEAAVDAVIAFLQGRDPTLAHRVLHTPLLPVGPRLEAVDLSAFGPMGLVDAARLLCTRYLADLADLVRVTVEPGFELARYQHALAVGPADFAPLAGRLAGTTLVDAWLDELADGLLDRFPDTELVGIGVPFPGALYGALRVGRRLRARGLPVLLGGGYVSTELRDTEEPRLWDSADGIVLDDGREPLLAWLRWQRGGPDDRHRTRTPAGDLDLDRPARGAAVAAWYADLDRSRYLAVLDTLNPAHRIWSEGRWNKVLLAHGCYWRKCSFCDTSLDYVRRFSPSPTARLVDAVEELVRDTGVRGFHAVDEAAPPRAMRDFALELLARGTGVSWWGNIRFERAFTPDLARLLAASGLVAVTGGLEVAGDRLLAVMGKGVRVDDAIAACAAFREAGVLVHAYLMFGFPGQTDAEIVDAAELVRQLIAAGLLDSAFWHRFVLTRHSPMGRDPARYGIEAGAPAAFARNDLPHRDLDPRAADPDRYDAGLARSLEAWMRGEGLDRPVHRWFPSRAPRTRLPPDRVSRVLAGLRWPEPPRGRLVWLGGDPLEAEGEGGRGALVLHHADGVERVEGDEAELAWLAELLDEARPAARRVVRLDEARAAFPGDWKRFRRRWRRVRRAGLVVV